MDVIVKRAICKPMQRREVTAVEVGGRLPAQAMDQLHEDGVGWDWSGVRTWKQGECMVLTTTVCDDSDPSLNEDHGVCWLWTIWAVTPHLVLKKQDSSKDGAGEGYSYSTHALKR